MSLHQTATLVRKSIALSIAGVIALIILISTFNTLKSWWRGLYPLPEPLPTTGFGKLPPLRLPALSIEGNPTYHLETATGELPDFPGQSEVIAMKKSTPSLLGEQRAKDLAKALDFAGEGELSEDRRAVVFRDIGDKRTLTVDITTQHFSLVTELSHIQETVPKGGALSGAEAVNEAQKFLSRNGLLKGDFDTGTQNTQVHQVTSGEIKDALSVSDGQFTRVDFFRTLTGVSGESSSILPPNPKTGLIQIWLTSGLKPEVNNTLFTLYTVWELDKEQVETYPLRPISTAWEEVQRGEGIAEVLVEEKSPLDDYVPQTLGLISIRNVWLAYFDDPSFQEYLQPIYVFSGGARTVGGEEADFTAYIQAVDTAWISD